MAKKIKNYELIKSAKQGDKNAVESLLIIYAGLIKKIASYYFYHLSVKHLELNELITEGQIGFINSIERFDLDRGYEISTFFSYGIKNSILNALRTSSIIKHSTRDVMNQVTKNKKNKDSNKTMLFELNLIDSCENMEICIHSSNNNNISVENNGTEDIVINAMNNKMISNDLKEGLNILSPTEKFIIIKFFGLNNCQSMNLKQISRNYNIPYSKVRKLKTLALTKLKQFLQNRNNNDMMSISDIV